jgi:hypothetical protein
LPCAVFLDQIILIVSMVAQMAAIAMMGLTDRICDITLPGCRFDCARVPGLRRPQTARERHRRSRSAARAYLAVRITWI